MNYDAAPYVALTNIQEVEVVPPDTVSTLYFNTAYPAKVPVSTHSKAVELVADASVLPI